MGTDTDLLTVALRGRRGELPVTRLEDSKRAFMVELPRRPNDQAVLDLHADYPKGEASFGASLSPPPPQAPPKPVLEAAGKRLTMARGSSCWSTPPVGLCVDTKPPTTHRVLAVRDGGRVRVDMRTTADLLDASIRRGIRHLRVRRLGGSRRRFVIRLPRGLARSPVLELFARYAQGDGTFGARLRVRRAPLLR
jgi:hypothetical protein